MILSFWGTICRLTEAVAQMSRGTRKDRQLNARSILTSFKMFTGAPCSEFVLSLRRQFGTAERQSMWSPGTNFVIA